jgi:lipoprotein-anchoring transpeptidase ErfK/SrfK
VTRIVVILVATLVATVTVAVGVTAWAYGDGLRDEGRLLPGTQVAGIDVGERTTVEAVAAVEDALAADLDRVVTLTHGDETWTTSKRELGADSDADAVVRDAFARIDDLRLTDLARLRWTGRDAGVDLDVRVDLPDGAVVALVDEVADSIDLAAEDATVTLTDDGVIAVTSSTTGRTTDRDAAVAALHAALADGADTVELEVADIDPGLDTDTAQRIADDTTAAVEQAVRARLDHQVTLVLGDRGWTTSPREVGATVATRPLLEAVLAAGGDVAAMPDPELSLPDGAASEVIGRIAADVDRPARDARIDTSDGRLQILDEQQGVALVRDEAQERLRSALRGASTRVELRSRTTSPSVTRDSFDTMLYLDQSKRRLALIVDGDVLRDWPVAVGLGGSPTPTGTFTVGAKRFEPTWTNPAPDRWGADMPASIGPGPDNPLGPRAINWNQSGRDTLIRFHGTTDESSIGEAASRGCVRMYNADVVELFDLVSPGMPIVSVG